MTSSDAGVPGEQRNDEAGEPVDRDTLNRWLRDLAAERARLRVELQAARDEAGAARRTLDEIHKALALLVEPGEHITPAELHHVEDQIVALCVEGIRTTIRRASSPDTETHDQQPGARPCGDLEPGCRVWPGAEACEYNPACCRFPKSCSANRCNRPAGHQGDHIDHSMPVGAAGRSWNDAGDYTGAVPETRDKETRHG